MGTVTEIDKTAGNSGGVTRYSAVVTFDKAEGMLPGMTADVEVHIRGAENVMIIPAAALHRTSTVYYVYTSYDETTQQYGGMKEVVAGMQNDSYAEIISGLEEGETVYYTEWETYSFMQMISGVGGGR